MFGWQVKVTLQKSCQAWRGVRYSSVGKNQVHVLVQVMRDSLIIILAIDVRIKIWCEPSHALKCSLFAYLWDFSPDFLSELGVLAG